MTNSITMPLAELDWLQTLAKRLAAGADADDLVQDTLLSAYEHPPQVCADRPLRPWLFVVARNRARMNARARTRREQREQHAADLITPNAGLRPDDELARVRSLQAVSAALDELCELDRRIIIRRFVDEENATQIGERLGIPPATVRSRLRRALAQLRASLDARHQGWALALVGPLPRSGEASAGVLGFGAKLGFTLTIGVGAAFAWSSCDRESTRGDEQRAAAVAPEQASAESSPSERERWEQRRAQIRAALAARGAAENADAPAEGTSEPSELSPEEIEQITRETRNRASAGFSELKRACKEDLDPDVSGAVTISVVVIGDPEVGTIYDSVEIVTETFKDPDVLACLREGMFSYLGEPPPIPVETQSVITTSWNGRDASQEQQEQRIFDAIIGAHHTEVAFCQRNDAFTEPGTALIEYTIDGTRSGDVHVVNTDLPEAVVECIVAASLRWAFPTTLSGKVFRYEFRLPVEGLDRVFEKQDSR